MRYTYKFNPRDFDGIQSMPEDLAAFYEALETYMAEKSIPNRIFLKNSIEDIELTLKHRMLNGLLSPELVGEIDNYIGELIYNA